MRINIANATKEIRRDAGFDRRDACATNFLDTPAA
jgi:hypothetical protein